MGPVQFKSIQLNIHYFGYMYSVYIQKSKKHIIAAHSTSFSSLAQKHTILPPLAPTRRPNSPTLRHDPSQESGLLPEQCAVDGGQELQRRSACTRGSAPPRWVAAAERLASWRTCLASKAARARLAGASHLCGSGGSRAASAH